MFNIYVALVCNNSFKTQIYTVRSQGAVDAQQESHHYIFEWLPRGGQQKRVSCLHLQ